MYGFKQFSSFLFVVFLFSFINISSAQEVMYGYSDDPWDPSTRVTFEDSGGAVELQRLEEVLEAKKSQIRSEDSSVKILTLRQLPKSVKLSDITFDVKLNEIILKSDRSIISAYRVNGRTSPNEIAKLINSDALGLVWIRVKIFDYKYEDASGNPIPTRPERGAFKAIPSEREAHFVIDAKYMEVDDELNIVKLPPFVTEVGLSVLKGPYDTMDLRKFGGFTSSVFKRSSEFYNKDRKMFALEDSWKNGKLLCRKGEVIGYYDPIFNAD